MSLPTLVAPLIVNGKAYHAMEDVESDVLLPSAKFVKLDGFAGAGALIAGPGLPRGLWVGTAGAANLKDGYGDTLIAFPLLAGYNPIMISEITSIPGSGGAANIWGMY